MKGVSPVIETVLMAAAVIIFLVYLMGAFNDFTQRVSTERTRTALTIDSQKVIHSIILSRKELRGGSSKFYLDLADIPSEISIKDGYVIAKTRSISVNTSIYNLDSYVTFQGRIKNTKSRRPFISSSGNMVTLGVE